MSVTCVFCLRQEQSLNCETAIWIETYKAFHLCHETLLHRVNCHESHSATTTELSGCYVTNGSIDNSCRAPSTDPTTIAASWSSLYLRAFQVVAVATPVMHQAPSRSVFFLSCDKLDTLELVSHALAMTNAVASTIVKASARAPFCPSTSDNVSTLMPISSAHGRKLHARLPA